MVVNLANQVSNQSRQVLTESSLALRKLTASKLSELVYSFD